MTKIIFLFILFLPSFAKEPVSYFLESIYSNTLLKFRYKNNQFFCQPYGVIGIDKILKNKNINKTCKKAFKDFIISNPDLINYTKIKLYVEQKYRIDFKENKCLIFSSGKKVLSEELLYKGLAIPKTPIKDEEYRYRFQKAYKSAKKAKRGIWKTPLLKTCIAEMYKK
jgi:hypothetical protein